MRAHLGAWATVFVLVVPGARAVAQDPEPEEGTQARIAAVADDAPLEAFVAQRELILQRERGTERGLDLGGAAMPLLQGVADFLVQRAEAEIEAYASTTLARLVCTEDRLLPILPATCRVLASWQEADRGGVGSGRARVEALVAALELDLRALPVDVVQLVLAHLDGEEQEAARLLFAVVAETVQAVLANSTPEELTDRLFRIALACDVRFEGGDEVRVCASEEGKRWQRDLLRLANVVRLALTGGLGLEDAVAFFGASQTPRLRAEVTRLVEDVRATQRAVSELRDAELAEADTRRVLEREVVVRMLALTVDGLGVVQAAAGRAAVPDRTRSDLLEALRLGTAAVQSGDATSALAATVELVRALGEVAGALGIHVTGSLRIPPEIISTLTTIVALADAEDRDAVRAILEQVAAPVGSWRTKRRGFTASVTGLVGFSGVGDVLLDPSVGGSRTTLGFALHASIGLDLSLVGDRTAGTFGVYLSMLDLGSIASAPFGLELVRTVGMRQERVQVQVDPISLFSPGVWVRWGILDSPLVLAAGVSYVPHARLLEDVSSTNPTDRTTRALDAVRFSLSLAIDTTLWIL